MSEDATALILSALGRLEAGQTEIGSRLAGIEDRWTSLEDRWTSLEDRLTGLEVSQSRLEAGLSKLRADVMDRIDRLQDKVTMLRDDIVVNYASGDRIERMVRGATDETRALAVQVTAMERQIMNLQADVRRLEGGA